MHQIVAALLSFGIGATVGLLGGGGSMLTLPMLVYVLHVAPRSAVSASLLVVAVTGVTGVLVHASAGRVAWRAGAVFGLAGMAGAYGGGHLARWIPERAALAAFSVLMLASSLTMMRARRARARSPVLPDPRLPRSIAAGAAVGALSGLLGAGGSFLIVPVLENVAGLGIVEAVATSPLISVMQSLAGFAGRLSSVDLSLPRLGGICAIAVAGSVAGAKAARRLSPAALRRAFALLVMGVAVFLLARQISPDESAPPPEEEIHG